VQGDSHSEFVGKTEKQNKNLEATKYKTAQHKAKQKSITWPVQKHYISSIFPELQTHEQSMVCLDLSFTSYLWLP